MQMQIYSKVLFSQLQISSIVARSADVQKIIRSGKQHQNKKHSNGVTVSIKLKMHEDTLDSAGLEKTKLNYERLVF
jgi:hypothetical protein